MLKSLEKLQTLGRQNLKHFRRLPTGHQLVVAGLDCQPHEGRDGSDMPINVPPAQPSTGPGTPQWQPLCSPLFDFRYPAELGNVVGGRTPAHLAVPHPPDSSLFSEFPGAQG